MHSGLNTSGLTKELRFSLAIDAHLSIIGITGNQTQSTLRLFFPTHSNWRVKLHECCMWANCKQCNLIQIWIWTPKTGRYAKTNDITLQILAKYLKNDWIKIILRNFLSDTLLYNSIRFGFYLYWAFNNGECRKAALKKGTTINSSWWYIWVI